ncbi:MaoC like domain protein [Hartmannibacter diazotrophicus]|uniref:MaoC like domain protein n=1 Tax=Hartmannibacter diazotrophicus TaxID=1482074 RepID=A0A2C9D8R0_9HYPH|nr:MaoC family dehydratase [Hartmannibacter diazotrophicus]SON56528.1 MaoC like domain protein [Hartmannibacter diazotrophicus]
MGLEAIELGVPVKVGSHTFEAEEIIRFAEKYDPQPFHVDEAAARASHFGALCASGWHTCSVWMRLTITNTRKNGGFSGISPGTKAIRWMKPVYVGDTLEFFNEVTSKREMKTRPGWALIEVFSHADNQNGVRVFEMESTVLVPIA